MHLTNVAIQKTAEAYDKRAGCKWGLRELKMFLTARHGLRAVDRLFYDIQSIVTRSLLAVSNVMIADRHCFELYGCVYPLGRGVAWLGVGG